MKLTEKNYAIVELPVRQFGRFVQLPSVESVEYDAEGVEQKTTEHYIMYLDDVIRCALPYMFPGTNYNHFEAWSFKFTKDAEIKREAKLIVELGLKNERGVFRSQEELYKHYNKSLMSTKNLDMVKS